MCLSLHCYSNTFFLFPNMLNLFLSANCQISEFTLHLLLKVLLSLHAYSFLAFRTCDSIYSQIIRSVAASFWCLAVFYRFSFLLKPCLWFHVSYRFSFLSISKIIHLTWLQLKQRNWISSKIFSLDGFSESGIGKAMLRRL